MHVEGEITVDRPRPEVFGYIARGELLPEYVTEFAWVRQESEGAPGKGTRYSYEMKRGATKGTWEWTEFEPYSRLAWRGPPAKSGPGSIAPAGYWDISETPAGGTHLKLVMTPTPGGLFKLLAPLMQIGMRKGNARALALLKHQLEGAVVA